LLALGVSRRRTVGIVGVFSAGVAATGVSIAFLPPGFTPTVLAGAFTVMFAMLVYGLTWLGYTEFVAFSASIVAVIRNGRLGAVQETLRASESASQATGASNREEIQSLIATLVDDMKLLDIEVVAPTEAIRAHGLPVNVCRSRTCCQSIWTIRSLGNRWPPCAKWYPGYGIHAHRLAESTPRSESRGASHRR
jgi:hypothetical protein